MTTAHRPIYLDYAATTPVDPLVVADMLDCLSFEGSFANPASSHIYGWQASQKIDEARHHVAQLLQADAREVVWTSGATEAINLAIKGYAYANKHRGRHIITCQTEHKAVLDTCAFLADQGFEITYLKPDQAGRYSLSQIEQAITEQTILLSIMWVNNETGAVQDIEAISQLAQQNKICLHVDAVQAIGKLAIDLSQIKIDLLSMTAHKIYGPKGIGALYIRRGKPLVRLQALIHGGGHERGLRSGTLATHQIVGMGCAFDLAKQRLATDSKHFKALKQMLWQGISTLDSVHINGDFDQDAPHILNVCFDGIDGEALLMALQGMAVSSGSACTSATIEPSHVLRAMGRSDQQAHGSIRFSLGRLTTKAEIEQVIVLINRHVNQLRQLSPLWKQ